MGNYIIAIVNSVSRWGFKACDHKFVYPLGMETIRDPVGELRWILKKANKYGYPHHVKINKALTQGWVVYIRHPNGTPLHTITCVKDKPLGCKRYY